MCGDEVEIKEKKGVYLLTVVFLIPIIYLPYYYIKAYKCPECKKKLVLLKYCGHCDTKVKPVKAIKMSGGYVTSKNSGVSCIFFMIFAVIFLILAIPIMETPGGIFTFFAIIGGIFLLCTFSSFLSFIFSFIKGDHICPNCKKEVSGKYYPSIPS